MGQTTHRPSVWCSKHYFSFIISYRIRALKILYFYFCKIVKKKFKGFLRRILEEIMKKIIILGRSDTWSTSRLSHRPSNPAYYIEDWRIFGLIYRGCPPYSNFWGKILAQNSGKWHCSKDSTNAKFPHLCIHMLKPNWLSQKQKQNCLKAQNYFGIFTGNFWLFPKTKLLKVSILDHF